MRFRDGLSDALGTEGRGIDRQKERVRERPRKLDRLISRDPLIRSKERVKLQGRIESNERFQVSSHLIYVFKPEPLRHSLGFQMTSSTDAICSPLVVCQDSREGCHPSMFEMFFLSFKSRLCFGLQF